MVASSSLRVAPFANNHLCFHQGLTVLYFVSHAQYPQVPLSGGTSVGATPSSGSLVYDASQNKGGAGSTSSGSGEQAALGNMPMALTPNDPGFDDLVGIAPGPRMNATFVTLARNGDVWEIARSIRHVEDRFNRRYNYDWVFLNDKPFDLTFKKVTTSLISGKTYYGEIPQEHWSFPEWIDQERAKRVREQMKEKKIIYGDSVSYRHMCRFESGFFFRQPLMITGASNPVLNSFAIYTTIRSATCTRTIRSIRLS